jgi:hypothetical protein
LSNLDPCIGILAHPLDERGLVVGKVRAFAGMSGKNRFEIGEQGFDEVRAGRVAGGLHLVGDSGTHQAGHGPIQCFAKLDGLEVSGFFVEPGNAQGIEESPDRVEERRPVAPLWEGVGIRPGEEEAPFLVTEDREGFFPADADGADMTGCGEGIEAVLDGITFEGRILVAGPSLG